ncbi:fatty acyl-CoA reductase wat-like [Scaptodrosophila lebanonensis]|uniref:Fatty acyl-CoA reductase n=1 Tax=Drosophila lebanonensis TaxID=7225 RepID=A0A6J2T9T4_DROLE|nr:fatty acyl-CoA reductase wat-like [Scaptodrosophila lebanonensis]XP_030371708.1 fatty acyl-CoA reductase wat-like [Scaptodrosophila lebanonensis]
METEVQAFYKNKTIFVTGGSGFLGKVVIEKIMRTTEVKRLYILMRPKRGVEIHERIASWLTDPVFQNLLNVKPNAFECLVPIAGDCAELDLGISEQDRQILRNEVQIVIHSAATVRFNEPLHHALDINVRATRLVMELGKEMQHLESFVHVSTAFSNCVVNHIKETYYPELLSCPAAKVLELKEQLSNELLDKMTPALLDKFPNTYTYTKALAEHLVQTESGDLPMCIFRPGIIIASYKEPVSGWIDNLYGPISILLAAAFGVMRICRVDVKKEANVVPVDFCANLLIASVWKTAIDAKSAKEQKPEHITQKDGENSTNNPIQKEEEQKTFGKPIYNFVSSEHNPLTWGAFIGKVSELGPAYPITKMMWFPFLIPTNSQFLYQLLIFFYHVIPGYAIDLILRLRGKRPRMVKLYEKIHKNFELLGPFVDRSWKFQTTNMQRLWEHMSISDRKVYEFDITKVNWNEYFSRALAGMRIYLAKEEPGNESIERGQKIRARFEILHRLLQVIVCSAGAVILWSMVKLLIRF